VRDLENDLNQSDAWIKESEMWYDTLFNQLKDKERDTFKLDSTLRAKNEIEWDIEDKQNVINELRNQIRESIKKEENLRSQIREIERNFTCEKEKV